MNNLKYPRLEPFPHTNTLDLFPLGELSMTDGNVRITELERFIRTLGFTNVDLYSSNVFWQLLEIERGVDDGTGFMPPRRPVEGETEVTLHNTLVVSILAHMCPSVATLFLSRVRGMFENMLINKTLPIGHYAKYMEEFNNISEDTYSGAFELKKSLYSEIYERYPDSVQTLVFETGMPKNMLMWESYMSNVDSKKERCNY